MADNEDIDQYLDSEEDDETLAVPEGIPQDVIDEIDKSVDEFIKEWTDNLDEHTAEEDEE